MVVDGYIVRLNLASARRAAIGEHDVCREVGRIRDVHCLGTGKATARQAWLRASPLGGMNVLWLGFRLFKILFSSYSGCFFHGLSFPTDLVLFNGNFWCPIWQKIGDDRGLCWRTQAWDSPTPRKHVCPNYLENDPVTLRKRNEINHVVPKYETTSRTVNLGLCSKSTQTKALDKYFLSWKFGFFLFQDSSNCFFVFFCFSPILIKLARVSITGVYGYLPKTLNPSYNLAVRDTRGPCYSTRAGMKWLTCILKLNLLLLFVSPFLFPAAGVEFLGKGEKEIRFG